MGCGCGSRKNIKINMKNRNMRKLCPKCRTIMGYKQVYSPKSKRYIKRWECPRCKHMEVMKI